MPDTVDTETQEQTEEPQEGDRELEPEPHIDETSSDLAFEEQFKSYRSILLGELVLYSRRLKPNVSEEWL